MESTVIVLYADNSPMQGVAAPGPHQTYRRPRVVIENRPLGPLDPDEIRVEMIYAGLCGTDVHLVETDPETGYIRSSAPMNIPPEGRVIGHEGVGRVLETGGNVRHLKAGSHVTFESIIVCHFCDVCRKGHFNQCRNALLMGLEKDGLFGTVVDVPAMLAHDISDVVRSDRDLRAMACVEPAGVAYVACQNTAVRGGDNVVIFGAGPIGLFTAMLGKLVFGASVVHMVEPVPFRREFARPWCDHVYDVPEFFDALPDNVDVVIEASGAIDNVNRVFRRISPNGRVALLARSGKPFHLDALDHMITNEVRIIGSRGHLCGAFSDIIILYRQGRLPLDRAVTHVTRDMEELRRILQTPDRIVTDNCKVLAGFGPARA
jgi:D-xylulose reductase